MKFAPRSIENVLPAPLSPAELDYLRGGLMKISNRMSPAQMKELGMLLIELSRNGHQAGTRHRVEYYA